MSSNKMWIVIVVTLWICLVKENFADKTGGNSESQSALSCDLVEHWSKAIQQLDKKMKICSVNGTWSSWSDYTPCNNHTGMQIRTRQCNNPRPFGGGAPCEGEAVETIICGSGSFKPLPRRDLRLRQSFVSRKKTVSSREECIKICLNKILNPNCEVFQIEYESTTPNKFRCRTSTVRSMYLPAFVARYFEVDPDYDAEDEENTFYEIYYLNVASDFSEDQSPDLFYALDDVSKNLNLGKLNARKYAINMGSTPAHYSCDFALGKSKLIRLTPSEDYRISIPDIASIPFNGSTNVTISLWIKKRLPEGQVAPILEGTSKGYTIGEWLLWNFDGPYKIYPLFGRNKVIMSPSLNARAWNYIVMRIEASTMELYVNNQLEGSVSLAGSVRSLGDTISIGRRIGNPSGWGPSSNMFDGCIGYLMLFTRPLSTNEIIQYGRLALDNNF